MTLTAIARKAADIAADKAYRSRSAARADLGCSPGIATSQSDFADKERRRVIAQAEAGSVLDGELTVRADFTRFYLQMAAQRVSQSVGPGEGADGRAAHTRYGSAHRLSGEHRIEIYDTVHVGEWHAQDAAHFRRNGFGKPTVELLCKVQGRQESSAALRRQLCEDRAQRIEFAISHLVFQASVSFHFHRCLFL